MTKSPFVYSAVSDTLRILINSTLYWSQITITVAIALERYIVIALSTHAQQLMKSAKRRLLYALAIVLPFAMPVAYLTDFLLHGFGERHRTTRANEEIMVRSFFHIFCRWNVAILIY